MKEKKLKTEGYDLLKEEEENHSLDWLWGLLYCIISAAIIIWAYAKSFQVIEHVYYLQ
jgi:hypothetical protein